MQLMKEGDKWELYIPSDLAYGDRGAGGTIKGGNALIFQMEIIKVRTGQTSGVFSQISDTLSQRLFAVPPPVDFVVRLWHVLAVYAFFTMGGFSAITGRGGAGAGGKRCVASHILVKDLAECVKIKESIAKCKDPAAGFAEAAKAHSTCPSGKSGGSLGEFGPGQMVPAFDKVCFSDCPLGEVQGPVETQFGHHLLIVEKRSDPSAEAKAKKN
jgi:peptidyl-prolyl cis-trans isomerase C